MCSAFVCQAFFVLTCIFGFTRMSMYRGKFSIAGCCVSQHRLLLCAPILGALTCSSTCLLWSLGHDAVFSSVGR